MKAPTPLRPRDEETQAYSERDPIEAGMFEVDAQGNRAVRIAGEGVVTDGENPTRW
ncbi:MAG: hypothetical protein ACR2OZ_09330 [Verrucomicrobiales bacterium]